MRVIDTVWQFTLTAATNPANYQHLFYMFFYFHIER